MNREPCPSTIDLWPEVVAESLRPDVARHVTRCRSCRLRIADARRKLTVVRALGGARDIVARPSAESGAEYPTQVGDCAVLGLLGEGGQSVVYRAWHPRLNTEIAIKRLHTKANVSDSVLVHEAMILSSVQSSVFPQPLDLRQFGEESFLFLELIHGEPLASCGHELTPRQILKLVRELLMGLRELHEAQLLHLDLSPANVLVDENGNTRLIDFGLARRAHGPPGENLLVGGTPGFIAPELLHPSAEIDHRADLYGVGAILHFLLYGEAPQGRCDEPGPLRPEFAGDPLAVRLACIGNQAIHADPDQRWQSADAFLMALDQVDGRRSRARRWLTAGALLGAMLLGHDERLLDNAHAEVLVVHSAAEQRLRESPPLRLGDHIAFAFDAASSEAGLIVRSPSGTLVRLQPFTRVPSGAFRFPPNGGAVLRQERGTYVVYYLTLNESGLPEGLFPALGDLPAPPALSPGENLILSRSTARAMLSEVANDWARAFLECEHQFPGLVAIAFPVE